MCLQTLKPHYMSTLLYNQSNNFSEMKISLNGVLFNRNSNDSSILKRAKEATVAGVFCLLVPIMFTFFCIAKDILLDSFSLYANIMISSGLLFRVISLHWVSNLLSKQNSATKPLQIMAFILPSITFIVLGMAVRKHPSLFITEHFGKLHTDDAAAIECEYELDDQPIRKAV